MTKKNWEVVLPEDMKNGVMADYLTFNKLKSKICGCGRGHCEFKENEEVSCDMCVVWHLFQDAPEPKKVMRGSLIRNREDLNRMVDEWKSSANRSTPYQSFADFLGDMIPDPEEVKA